MRKPKFRHACDMCVFLFNDEINDVYVCQRSGIILVRFGDDEDRYEALTTESSSFQPYFEKIIKFLRKEEVK